MSKSVIEIDGETGKIIFEDRNDSNISTIKQIDANTLVQCIKNSIKVECASGLLPKGCLYYSQNENGDRRVCIEFQEHDSVFQYYNTRYENFPLPRLIFGFNIKADGKVESCDLGVLPNTELKPNSELYHYPFSNVSNFRLCIGANPLPRCKSLYMLNSLPYYIMSMPNNDDSFNMDHNKLRKNMRELVELLKDKEPAYYYSDVLIPCKNATLNQFLNH